MIIDVTKRNIKMGEPESCYNCPIARALKREFRKQNDAVIVSNSSIWVGDTRYKPTKRVQTFINKFDSGEAVKPFSFRLIKW